MKIVERIKEGLKLQLILLNFDFLNTIVTKLICFDLKAFMHP